MKYLIQIELTTELNPNKWNWHELIELDAEEELFVISIEEVA